MPCWIQDCFVFMLMVSAGISSSKEEKEKEGTIGSCVLLQDM